MSAPYDFMVGSVGICAAAVCTSLTDEQATDRLNAEQPTGISSRWAIAADTKFADGDPNPSPCGDMPDTHRHILFHC